MYKVSVPIDNETITRFGKEATLRQVRRFDAERVFICLPSYYTDEKERKKAFSEMRENAAFFREKGFEVGAWIWTFMFYEKTPFPCMVGLDGSRYDLYACPAHEEFVSFAEGYVSDIARCGVDLIMFDDDFRYGFFGSLPGCLCEKHIKLINGITGEEHDGKRLFDLIMHGGKNKYRDAYIKANGDVFRAFALRMRKAVDDVDSRIRLGYCACMTGWDIDGVDAAELARLLAGGTRPFVRLIGAPYWAVKRNWGNMLQDTVELERMESAMTADGEIEIMAEGDVFPRPRASCPAAFLEGFDTAIRASGCTDGILKYGVDYTCDPATETGYARLYERNRGAHRFIEKNFRGEQEGVRVYCSMKKFADCVVPEESGYNPENLVFPMASRTLAYCSVPTVFSGGGICGAVFDENARNLPLSALDRGAILDISAARILTERGVDCGVESFGGGTIVQYEYFPDGDRIAIEGIVAGTFSDDVKLRDGAVVLSYDEKDGKRIPITFRYENAAGQRFFVLNVYPGKSVDIVMRHGKRGLQYAEAVKWLSGRDLPFFIPDCPALYVQCRRDGGRLIAGMWNFFPDPAMDPVARLDGEYSSAEFFNCTGRLEKDRLVLCDLPPFSFSAVILKK